MAANTDKSQNELDRYVRSYVTREIVQSSADASADPQLATIIGKIAERLSDDREGAILDVGCGHGTLLSRMAELPQFRDQMTWTYVAIDEEDKLDEIARLTPHLGISRRVEPIPLARFYEAWPRHGSPQLVVCRNVLHELTMPETAQLLRHVASNLDAKDEFIIQDLLRFPESERHHACWLTEQLSSCVKGHGFETVSAVQQGSRSGNAWVNIVAKNRLQNVPTRAESERLIVSARQQQWELWSALDQADQRILPDRPELVTALDLDLQLVSLTRQLRNAGALLLKLDEDVARRVRTAEFTRRVDAFVRANNLVKRIPEVNVHFRERGEQLNAMEAFLRAPERLALVFGGRGTGKTTFVNHLLKERLYEKTFVMIDGRASRGFWPIVEQLFAQVGLNLAAETLSVVGDTNFDRIKATIGQFFNQFAARMVLVVDNFDEFVDSNGAIFDRDIERLLEYVLSKEKMKVILISRGEYLPATLQDAGVSGLLPKVRMGRYGTDETVVNVLDDHFDRGKANLSEYPEKLIQAIDRHPLVATLAGHVLNRNGQGILLNDQFISEVRQKLRAELTSRLVDDQSLPAVEIASKLRVPVPVPMLERLAPSEAIYRARTAEVLYTIPDRRWQQLISSLGLFRRQTVDDMTIASLHEQDATDKSENSNIADSYYRVYRSDDDPKWIRESYFHRMLSGSINSRDLAGFVGRYYFPELKSSAAYCFKKHDYFTALELFEAAKSLSDLDETSQMWRASCLIRTGDRDEGERQYKRLAQTYPNNIGIRTSHVDALLSVNEDQAAIDTLTSYNLTPDMNEWVAQQWGRAHLGLHHYEEAIEIFRKLLSGSASNPFWFTYLARALQQFGDLEDAIEVLRKGRKLYPENTSILTSLGADLERMKLDEEAIEILLPLFEAAPQYTRVALALIRVRIREGNISGAEAVLKRARTDVPVALKPFLISAEAEVLSIHPIEAGLSMP